MKGLDGWREVLEVLSRRKLRSILSALSVSWGIFILIILIAAGQGLENGLRREFAPDVANRVGFAGNRIQQPAPGGKVGRAVQLDDTDYQIIRQRFDGHIESVSGVYYLKKASMVQHRDRDDTFSVVGCEPGYRQVGNLRLVDGRFFNPDDVSQSRDVAVISLRVRNALFRPGEPAVGARIQIGKTTVSVIGVHVSSDFPRVIFVPLSTARRLDGVDEVLSEVGMTVSTTSLAETESLLGNLRVLLARRHEFLPEDKKALSVWNAQSSAQLFVELFSSISIFVWFVGISTTIAGAIGVGNIMFISVAERTRELGIRKAIGASPLSLIRLIVRESMVISLVAGWAGLVAGVFALETLAPLIPPSAFFRQPRVNLEAGLVATGLLMLTGMLAGFIPALRAARVNPIQALRA